MHCNLFGAHWIGTNRTGDPESQEKDGDAPKDSAISVGQLRSRVSLGLHLPMLFQLAPQAVNDLLREAKAADDDAVSCMEIFTDGSSLISRAWPRMAASGGWDLSSPQFVTISALPSSECSLGKSQ